MLVDLKALKKRRNKMRIAKGMYLAKSGFEFNFHFLLEKSVLFRLLISMSRL